MPLFAFEQNFQKGKYLVTFLFFVLVPFINTEQLIDPSNAWRAFATALVALLFVFFTKHIVLPANRIMWWLGLFALVILSGTLQAHSKAEVFFELSKYSLFVIVVVLFLQALTIHRSEFFWSLRYFSSIIILICIWQFLQLESWSRSGTYAFRPFYEHKNTIAAALFALAGSQGYIALQAEKRVKLQALANGVLLLLIIFLLQVRSVQLASIGALAVFALLNRNNLKSRYFVLPLVSVILLVLLSVGLQMIKAGSSEPSAAGGATESLSERQQLWKKSLKVFYDYPLLGCGSGNWQFNYAKHSVAGIKNLENRITAQHPHNEYLSLLSENGLIGVIVAVVLGMILIQQLSYALKTTEQQRLKFLIGIGCGLAIDAFFSFPKERLITASGMALILAMVMTELNTTQTVGQKNRIMTKVILLLVIVYCAFVTTFRIRGEYFTKQLLSFQKSGNPREMLKAGQKAMSVFYTSDPTSSPISAYLGAAYYALNRPDSLVMECQRALELSPFDYECLSNLGFALTRYGDKLEARRVLEESLRINPKYEGARLNLAILDFSLGKYEDAYHQMLEINDVQTKYPEQFGAIYGAYAERVGFAQ